MCLLVPVAFFLLPFFVVLLALRFSLCLFSVFALVFIFFVFFPSFLSVVLAFLLRVNFLPSSVRSCLFSVFLFFLFFLLLFFLFSSTFTPLSSFLKQGKWWF